MLNESNKAGLIILVSVLFGIYCFVFGQSGILERVHLHTLRDTLANEITELEAGNAALYSTYLAYRSGRFNKRESEQYGFIREGEIVLFFSDVSESGETASGSQARFSAKKPEIEQSQTRQLRILWIILSIIIIFLYIAKNHTVTHEEVQEED